MARGRTGAGTRPSIHSVAAYAGVSIATVSKVMQGVATVRPENVKSVQNAIEALGYRINPLAAELRRGRRMLIGAIVPSFEDPFYGRLISALEKSAEQRGYALAATSSRQSEKREAELVTRLQDWRVAGLVVVPVGRGAASTALLLRESGLATVFIGFDAETPQFDSVSADRGLAISDVSRVLVRRGHRRIAILHRDAPAAGAAAPPRALGEALAALDASVAVDYVDMRGAQAKAAAAIGDALGRVTAAVTFWAPAALTVLSAAADRQLSVPRDLSLFSFDDADWMQAFRPRIGSLRAPAEQLGARAIETLFGRLDKPGEPPRAALEPCAIDFRASLADAPGGAPAAPAARPSRPRARKAAGITSA